jgi:hypothetical protein
MALDEATPEAVAEHLSEFRAEFENPVAWSDLRRMAPSGLGEVHSPGDWRALPSRKEIRVLSVRDDDGLHIRWADTDDLNVIRALRGSTHEDLLGRGESLRVDARSGWVFLEPDEERLRVTS